VTSQDVILLAEDDRPQRELLGKCLREWGFQVVDVPDGNQALAVLDSTPVDMVISDVRMPGKDGLTLAADIRRRSPDIPILLITAFPEIRQAVEAVKDGALDYLTKPVDLDELRDLVSNALGSRVHDAGSSGDLPPDAVFASPQMKRLLRDARLVADSTVSVLITGESGTGKEIVADILHSWSARSEAPMVKLNCATIPENMLESEIFGHEKGAFTGAASARDGRWKAADGGTLLLDEIGELPLSVQAKLLRSLQDGSYSPLGSDCTLFADVRILAATNRELEEEVAEGRFREDLYYRLNVVELHVPPLRDRPEDIMPLAVACAREFIGSSARIGRGTERVLLAYAWPGNVRELRNAVQRACLMARGDVVMPEHLPPRILEGAGDVSAAGTDAARTLADAERQTILAALARCNGNRTRAAQELGIGRRTLIYKLKSYSQTGE